MFFTNPTHVTSVILDWKTCELDKSLATLPRTSKFNYKYIKVRRTALRSANFCLNAPSGFPSLMLRTPSEALQKVVRIPLLMCTQTSSCL